jgi:hypothetical protein
LSVTVRAVRTGVGTCHDQCNSDETPAKAVNGSVSGGTSDKFCSLDANAFLQVDLGTSKTISRFVVRHSGAGGEFPEWDTVDFDIAVSTDGTTFTTVARVRGNTSDVTTNTVSTKGRYIRLNIITPAADGTTAARIYEFEAYS